MVGTLKNLIIQPYIGDIIFIQKYWLITNLNNFFKHGSLYYLLLAITIALMLHICSRRVESQELILYMIEYDLLFYLYLFFKYISI